MILSYDDILKEIKSGELRIETPDGWPTFHESQIRPSSIDLRVGKNFYRWRSLQEIQRDPGLRNESRQVRLNLPEEELATEQIRLEKTFTEAVRPSPEGHFVLQPGDFVLAPVLEFVSLPKSLAARIEGRTRFARLGLEVHSTAPTIRVGWGGHIYLELKNVNPALVFEITPGARICQLILERVLTPPTIERKSSY